MVDTPLKVLEAYTRDVGRGVARIDYDSMDSRGVSTGDIIEIKGNKRKTVRQADAAFSGNFGGNLCRNFYRNSQIIVPCDNTGVAGSSCLQHLGTSRVLLIKRLLRCLRPDFLTPSAFDWRDALQKSTQQADLKHRTGAIP